MSYPNESAEYRAARDALLGREVELRRATEAVAAARRALPPGGEIPEDYAFADAAGEVRLSELFAAGRDSLALYSFMFPRYPDDDRLGEISGELSRLPLADWPCPSCVAFLDQLDGAARHAAQNMNLAIVAKASPAQLEAIARERGWRHLRLLSSAGSSYHADYRSEYEGHTMPMLNVFERDGATIRHFWGSELYWAPREEGQDPRHAGTLEPLWNLFDLTREGRPADWHEQLSY
jgi:predicted dithiol-disulfide oxidoreductase (DUF899 family)